MNAFPSCNDELEPRAIRLARLAEAHKEPVFVTVPFLHGVGGFTMFCTLAVSGGEILRTEFPENWRTVMADHGYPTDSEAEKFLEALAWLEHVRAVSR